MATLTHGTGVHLGNVGRFKDYPPRQTPASFNLDEIVDKLLKPAGG